MFYCQFQSIVLFFPFHKKAVMRRVLKKTQKACAKAQSWKCHCAAVFVPVSNLVASISVDHKPVRLLKFCSSLYDLWSNSVWVFFNVDFCWVHTSAKQNAVVSDVACKIFIWIYNSSFKLFCPAKVSNSNFSSRYSWSCRHMSVYHKLKVCK